MLEQRHPTAVDLGLERCGAVYRQLGSPRPARRVFTVAGTNGKGSTVAYLDAINARVGHRHGSYTSPHISRFNERVRIMGEPVSDESLVGAFRQVEEARGEVSLTYFEFTTIAALLLLHRAGLDDAVLEVGLGGRLDAVNLVDADCTFITPIGLDHQDYLGTDINSIATEKAGIVRSGIPLVCTENQPPDPVLKVAAQLQAPVYRRGVDFDLVAFCGPGTDSKSGQWQFSMGTHSLTVPQPPMGGRHQLDNLAAALAGFLLLNPTCFRKADVIGEAIRQCRLPGRLQAVHTSPEILLDVGHNELAAGAVAAYLEQTNKTDVTCVLAMLADKPAEAVALALDRVCRRWLCVGTCGSRGQNGASLARRLKVALPAIEVEHYGNFDAVMKAAMKDTDRAGIVLVFGSFSIVSDAAVWLENTMQRKMHDAAKITEVP